MNSKSLKNLTVIHDVYVEGYNGAFLREIDKDGNDLPNGIWGAWYTASAIDDESKEYQVFWKILDSFDLDEDDDESLACDWKNPWMVLDEDGKNVVGSVYISFGS